MMLDWFYRLIRFRQRRTIVLRLKSSFISTESGRLTKHEPAGDARSRTLTAGSNRIG
jgi:hypothetical protein